MNRQRKIKILYFHPTIVFGGAERTTTALLEKLDASIFDVILVTKKDIFLPLPVRKIMYIDDLGVKDGFSGVRSLIRDIAVMCRLVIREAPDLVFGMLHYGCMVPSFIKFVLRGRVKVIVSPRTPSEELIKFYFKDKRSQRILWSFLVRFFCRNCDAFVVASNGIKEECVNKYGAKRNNIFTVPNSTDAHFVRVLSGEVIDREKPPDTFIISTAGRLAAEKNIAVLLKAFALLRKDLQAQLWIIGDGPEMPFLKSLATTLNILNDIVFLGFQENPYKFIKRSDAFVHTSLFEGFGNTILEAMACGVPLIATDCPFGPGEIIQNRINGILVPASDEIALKEAIKLVLTDRDLKRKLIEGALKRLADFSVEKMVKGYEEVFLKVQNR